MWRSWDQIYESFIVYLLVATWTCQSQCHSICSLLLLEGWLLITSSSLLEEDWWMNRRLQVGVLLNVGYLCNILPVVAFISFMFVDDISICQCYIFTILYCWLLWLYWVSWACGYEGMCTQWLWVWHISRPECGVGLMCCSWRRA